MAERRRRVSTTPEQRTDLLLLGCSATKRRDSKRLRAVDRYDGVNFRVVRKLQREGRWPESVNLRIISAKHGLLRPDDKIGYYDLRMTPARAQALRDEVLSAIREDLALVSEVFVNLGRAYGDACRGLPEIWEPSPRILEAHGAIGMRMAQMKRWLLSSSRLRPTSMAQFL